MHSSIHLTSKCISGYSAVGVQCHGEVKDSEFFLKSDKKAPQGAFPLGKKQTQNSFEYTRKVCCCYVYLYLGENEWGFGMPYLIVGFIFYCFLAFV